MELLTERLRLRNWIESDRAPFATMSADLQVMRNLGGTMAAPESNAAVDRWQARIETFGWGFWAAELRETGDFIGVIGAAIPIRFHMPFENNGVEIGWRLAPQFWKKGLATEGAQACVKFGFEILEREKLYAITSLNNEASRKVMERVGMKNTRRDFDHPALAPDHELSRHCLYEIKNPHAKK